MSTFSYACLCETHADPWHALMLEGVQSFPLGFLTTEAEVRARSFETQRAILNAGATRGVFDGEKLVGFCGFRPQHLTRTKHRAELGPFCVTATYQGTGAASALMNGVIDEATKLGLARLELYVDVENTRAITFYEKVGFERVTRIPDGVRIDGQSRDDYLCYLDLTDRS